MPFFDCIEPVYLTPFMKKGDGDEEEYDTLCLIGDINEWWLDLPCDVRRRTPLQRGSYYSYAIIPSNFDFHLYTSLVAVYAPDEETGYDTGVIWFRTRRVRAENIESLKEIEADKIVKRRFLEALGDGFDENQAYFFTKKAGNR